MLLGISGKKQTGKDTICIIFKALDIYIPEYGDIKDFVKSCLLGYRLEELELFRDIEPSWEKHAFADKMKQCVAIILGCNVSDLEKEEFKESYIPWIREDIFNLTADGFGEVDNVPITVRKLLQKFGTEIGRNIDSNLWVNALLNEYTPDYRGELPNWIIPDVRFSNEAQAIIDKGGILIRVNKDTGKNDTHISETALDNWKDWDYVVDNNGSWDNLITQIIAIHEKL